MDLERISVVLRERDTWEAVDLGFAMTRRWLGAAYGAWLVVVLPLALILNVALYEFPWIALVATWWFKPLLDRLPLAVISRGFFGEPPRPLELLRQPGRFLGRGLFLALTWRRLSPWRSYSMPVDQLEALEGGRARRRRLAVLGQEYRGISFLLTLVCLLFELLLLSGLFLLLELLVPGSMDSPSLLDSLSEDGLVRMTSALYLIAMSAIEPFFVGAGFSLYINRRVTLEGWDIELGFRRMSRRLARLASGLPAAIVVAALTLGLSFPARAAEPIAEAPLPAADTAGGLAPDRDPGQVAADVLSAAEFGTKEERRIWRLREEEQQPEQPEPRSGSTDLGFFSGLGRFLATVLFWLIAGVGVLLLAYLIAALIRSRRSGTGRDLRARPDAPEVLFGLDVRPESLPDDLLGAARQAWQRGEPAAALSLLYRGALVHLISRQQVEIPGSATEGECMALVQRRVEPLLAGDFAALALTWQRTAYAHRPPNEPQFSRLCLRWARHLEGAA